MATLLQWSDLPAEILPIISKLLASDVDFLRLRSVCSPWRSSLPPSPPIPFHLSLKLPLPFYTASTRHANGLPNGLHCTLRQLSFYCLSPLAAAAADSSNVWLFKAYETNPKTFSLRDPLSHYGELRPPGATLPTQVNLLDYRISVLCKSYSLGWDWGSHEMLSFEIKKVIPLSKYVVDCDFAVLALHEDGRLICWRLGEDDWTPIDTKGYEIDDMAVCGGICYCVGSHSMLFSILSIDSGLNLAIVVAPRLDYHVLDIKLVEWDSELCIVSKFMPEEPVCGVAARRFDKCSGDWKPIEDLEDLVFVLGLDVSFGVYAKEFGHCEGSRVYLYETDYAKYDSRGILNGVYQLKENIAYGMEKGKDFEKMFVPGSWFSC